MKNLNSQLVLTADHDQVFHLRQMIGNYWVSQKILQIKFIFYIVFGVWLGLFENKIWWVCRVTFPRQYWLVWQYWQRVWIYMVWPASLFVFLLFLCTSPCWPSAHLSACCRNQSFPENREKHHQAISYFELSPKAMIGKSSLSMIGKSYHHLIWNLDPKSMMGNLMFKIGNFEAIQWLESLTCSSSFSCWAFIFSWKTQCDASKRFQIKVKILK